MSHVDPALPARRPFIVGHRAANELAEVGRAIRRGVDMIEADVWRYHKRLEVRHLKTMGRVPLLWDRWSLAPGWTPRLQVEALLDVTPPDLPIMFDLKGEDPQLPLELIDTIRQRDDGRAIILCTRNWIHLDRVRDQPDVHRIYSIGNERERDRVWSRLEAMQHRTVSIHRKLVTPALMNRFRERDTTVISWGSVTRAEAGLLLSLGVDGVTVPAGPVQTWLLEERHGTRETGM